MDPNEVIVERVSGARQPPEAAPPYDRAMPQHREPDSGLLTYYLLISLVLGPLFPFAFLVNFFKYRTLRYEFDAEGVTMRWGLLFRREISLTYARIQDIHLVSNLVERWLGLARIQIQTASGSAGAEMTIEGLKDFEAIRDRLYLEMRGARGAKHLDRAPSSTTGARDSDNSELVAALEEATAELRRLRESLATTTLARGGGDGL